LLASSGSDGSVRVWDVASQTQLRNFDDHVGEALRIDWSFDDKWLASASRDGTVRVWDPATGKQVAVYRTQGRAAMCASFRGDAKRLAAGCADGIIRLWDISSRKSYSFKIHKANVLSVAWSPDGESVISIGEEPAVIVWNPEDGRRETLRPSTRTANKARWSWDGKRVALTDLRSLVVWDNSTGAEVFRQEFQDDSWPIVCWSPDGSRLAAQTKPGSISVWETERWTLRSSLSLNSSDRNIHSLDWSHDGKWLAAVDGAGWIGIWDAETGVFKSRARVAQEIIDDPFRMTTNTRCVRWSPDGTCIVAGIDKDVIVWQTMSGDDGVIKMAGHALPVTDLCWSPDGNRLATSSQDGTVKIWDPSTGHVALTLTAGKSVSCVSWHPDGMRIVSGTRDGSLQIWDATSGYEQEATHRETSFNLEP